jgi:PAS domain S-box-containing protein
VRILLIDEAADTRDALLKLLADAGMPVAALHHAPSTVEVVELSACCRPVLCFIRQPSAFGAQVLNAPGLADAALIVLIDDGLPVADELPGDRVAAYLPWNALPPRILGPTIRAALRHADIVRRAHETERLSRIVQEAADIGTWDWDMSTQNVVWSPQLYRIFGISTSMPGTELYRCWLHAIHPDDRDLAQAAAAAAIAGLAPLQSRFRIYRQDPDRAGAPAELRWILCKGEVLRDAEGRPVRLIGINIDVTEKQHKLAGLQASHQTAVHERDSSEARFRTYFESTPDCMFYLRAQPDGRLVYEDVNSAGLAVTGLSLEEMRGRTPEEMLGPEKGQMMANGLRQVCETGEIYRYEPTWNLPSGTVTYDAAYMPLRQADGRVAGVLGVARDITERRRLEAALHQTQKMEALGQLASGIAHDFNNLLASFHACLQLIRREVTSAKGQRLLAEGERTIDRGKALTGWLLGFSRQQPRSLRPIDLNQSIKEIDDMVARAVGSDIRLHKQLALDLGLTCADHNQIELAILNLVLNARDAMPLGGDLTLSTRNETIRQRQPDGLAPGRYVVIEVTDTGKGMAPDVLARVLEPFFTTKEPGKGTGLGLSMVYGIVKEGGGGIRIRSTQGHGTCVSLFFPSAHPEAGGKLDEPSADVA